MVIWSHNSNIETINSGGSISYSIDATIEDVDPITMEPIFITVSDLVYEEVNPNEALPDNIDIQPKGTSVDINGTIDANSPFIEIAYSKDGDNIFVDSVDVIPKGAKPTKLIPSSTQYKYFKWRVYSISEPSVDRTFTLTVIVSWNSAKNAIKELVEDISI